MIFKRKPTTPPMNIGKQTKTYNGTAPTVPAHIMLIIAQRIWEKRRRG
jgi:hypothetical protein